LRASENWKAGQCDVHPGHIVIKILEGKIQMTGAMAAIDALHVVRRWEEISNVHELH
jgi:hypothetical protein